MNFLWPDWKAPAGVRAIVTTRAFGNLALHAGDPVAASVNRRRLLSLAPLPREPVWLNQVHGNVVVHVGANTAGDQTADGSYTREAGVPLVVMTADCLPILIAGRDTGEMAVVHAGWRGLANNVISTAIHAFTATDLMVYLGPCIGACHYEVDEAVRQHFADPAGFGPSRDHAHWRMDLATIAEGQIRAVCEAQVFKSGICTGCSDKYFSYRCNHGDGRFATMIWRE